MKILTALGAVLALLFIASAAEAFGPVRHAAGLRSHNHLLLGRGLGFNNGLLLRGHGTVLHNDLLLRDRLLREQLLLRGRGTSFGYGGIGAASALLRDTGCGGGTVPASFYGAAGLNSCAPIGTVGNGLISPSMSLRLRIN